MKEITVDDIRANPEVKAYIEKADHFLKSIGYTEHGFRHAEIVSKNSFRILKELGFPERTAQLAAIAGLLHDIGNLLGRKDHGVSSALLAKNLLEKVGMPYEEMIDIMTAIGNHEEESGEVTDNISASLAIADKTDVHRSRVRTKEHLAHDIHDRVNYAVTNSVLKITPNDRCVTVELTIDTEMSQVMEYFEIFISRMVMCRKAAKFLGSEFHLFINGMKLL